MSGLVIAQITDVHFAATPGEVSGVDPDARLSRAIAAVNALTPAVAAVVVTGDLANGGEPAAYERLRDSLDGLSAPWYAIPGNHDDRAAMRAAFADRPWMPAEGFVCYCVDDLPIRLIMLDSLNDGHDGGRLCLERLAWLERALEDGGDRPTLVALHHPPLITGMPAFDADPFEGGDALAAILQGHRIERIVCGHLHRPLTVHWHGQTVSVAPSTAFHIALDMRPGAPHSLSNEPPAVLLHVWGDGIGVVTHTLYL